MLVGPVQKRLEQIIDEVITERGWQLIERAIQPNHVHLFVRTNPSTLPSDVPRLIKGQSSRLLRQEFAHLWKLPALWTHSYFLSTAGNVSSETRSNDILSDKAMSERGVLRDADRPIPQALPIGTPIHLPLRKMEAF